MASLISESLQAEMESALKDVFDTFKTPIQIYLEAQKVNVSTSSSFSRFGQNGQNILNPEVVPQVYTVYGCLEYGKKQDSPYLEPHQTRTLPEQLKVRIPDGGARLRIDEAGFALIKGFKLVVLDGVSFENNANFRPHGLFNFRYYDIILTKTL